MLGLLGFGQAGVSYASIASAWQSALGNVAAGSAFSTLQSYGATGGIGPQWPLLAAGAVLYLVNYPQPLPPALTANFPSRRGPFH